MYLKRSVLVLLAAVGSGKLYALEKPAARLPNIVIIMADDLGYADISINGAKDVKTPNIDALAQSGMQFSEAYVCYPACGPSRAGIMTGRHHMRFGFPCNPEVVAPTKPGNVVGLPQDEISLADLLKKQGYATACVGKWHLGFHRALHPLSRGFDEFFGFLNCLYPYFDRGNLQYPYGLMRGFEHWHEKEYVTDALARECTSFIKSNQKQPFLLYASFGAVHTPLMYDKDSGDVDIPLEGTDDVEENRRMLVNMIEGLDRGVGRIMDQIRECGLEKNTLVFFLSDNGGPEATGAYNNGPLRAHKGWIYEGGVRVPFFASWPGRIAPGQRCGRYISALDIFATSVAVAGGRLSDDRVYDSENLLPVLAGDQQPPEDRPLFWDALNMKGVRLGDWKLVVNNRKGGGTELYNIREDIGEKNNLIEAYPERAEQLRNMLKNWQKELPPKKFKKSTVKEFRAWMKQQDFLR